MSDEKVSSLPRLFHGARELATELAKEATDAAAEIAERARRSYEESSFKAPVDDAISRTSGMLGSVKAHLDHAGVTDAARSVSHTASDSLDALSGKKIFELVETRLALQATYNDVLATKLDEALRRIASLETMVAKQRDP